MTGVSLRKQLQTILEEKLLPAARGDAPLVLLEPPVLSLPNERLAISSAPALPLPKAKPCRSHIALHMWPDQFLNALRVPYLACVFEGEADITTALTTERAKQYSELRTGKGLLPFGRQTVSIVSPGFFLVPPGAPVSGAGSGVHWERPGLQTAYSRIFWIHLLPSGVFCHTCTSSKGRHRTHPFIFVADEQLPLLSGLLLVEATRREKQQSELTQTLLLSLLLKISHAFAREKSTLLTTGEALESIAALRLGALPAAQETPPIESDSIIVQRALRFVEANLNQALTPAAIAAQSYVSVSHLNRLFLAELSTPVMRYVTQQRLIKARALLTETDIPIAEVASLCGYTDSSHFSQLFTRHVRTSPRAYRNQRRDEINRNSR